MTMTHGTQVEVLSRELQRVTAENNDLHQQVRYTAAYAPKISFTS